VPWLLRVVSEEVGARKARWGPGAVLCLCAMVALWGVRDFTHRRALSILDSHTYADENPERFSALPAPVNPFSWTGIVETASAFHVSHMNVLDTNSAPEELGSFDKPQSSPPLQAAMNSKGGKVFLNFARFPWAQVVESDQGYLVTINDLRFYRPGPRPGFTLEVELDPGLRIRSESFRFAPARGAARN